ncbi:xanthine dehydrogenase family protein molybdopterin-binding subunit [Aquabacter spiritensis]|uniref:Carbon-monoxide dehydrogenase large subunit n=1 Tax=Aquabacter spiritensis TaxID=933073 RepID=A0A4R3LVT9_9HYPH|nr:xanthine dehydrogenase family protein molybdopterin-binding subunit [Aquabacter spiritensis]TCT04196.1 carbon-monoxide dehydrogenase large subunit [Aquabacter spiritensis]
MTAVRPPRLIGQPAPRPEAARLASGAGAYVDDVDLPRQLHAAFLRSPHPHAAILGHDATAARALPGVAAVLFWDDLAGVVTPLQTRHAGFPGLVSPPQPPLADRRVAYQGEPVALVLAASRALAEDALEAIAIDYAPLPAAADAATALDPGAPKAHPDLPDNLCWAGEISGGDVDGAFRDAALVVAQTFRFTRHTGVTLEPRGLIAAFDRASGQLDVRISHQQPHQLQVYLADLLGLPMTRVRVIAPDVGGGFGIKMHVYADEVAVCAAARLLGRPVKFIADRLESMAADVHAREHVVDARMALDAAGRITAFDVADRHGLGAYTVFPRSSTMETVSAVRTIGAPYAMAAFRARMQAVFQNKSLIGQYRSVGHPIACTVTEALVDQAARTRGEDPLAFRARNYTPGAALPFTNPAGVRLIDLSHAACHARLEALMDRDAVRRDMADARARGRLPGLGFAAFVELTASGSEAYGAGGVAVAAMDSVTLALEPDGTVKGEASVSEIGQGIAGTLARVVADALALPADQVRIATGDTRSAPHGGGAWSSRGAAIGAEAALGAAARLRAAILAGAAALLQAQPETLDLADGAIVDASGAPRLTLAALAQAALFRGHEFPGGRLPQLAVAHQHGRAQDRAVPTNGIQAALVEIDPGTGLVACRRHWVVEDCGRILNPLLVDAQIRGGVVQGIGAALYEACRYDGEGQLLTGTLADYLLPMAAEMPDIAVAHVETPYSGSVLGAKGAGEAGTCAAAAAVLNAVNDALAPFGTAIAELPVTPVLVLDALARRQAA